MMRVGVGLRRRITESGVVRLSTIVRKVQMRVMFQMFVVLDARRQGYDNGLAVLHNSFMDHLCCMFGFVDVEDHGPR